MENSAVNTGLKPVSGEVASAVVQNFPKAPQNAPPAAPVSQKDTQQSWPLLPGVVAMSSTTVRPPMLLIISAPKFGKSATSICSLFGWPTPDKQPLVLAWDPTGPIACNRLGFYPHVIPIIDQPGAHFWDKAQHALNTIETNAHQLRQRYGAIVVDCASTMVDRLHEDSRRFSKNTNPMSHFGDALMRSKEFINRVVDLGFPTVWLAWLREAERVEEGTGPNKRVKFIPGGPHILGSTRNLLAGRADHILLLEKTRAPIGTQGADGEGYIRQFHTRPWNEIECGGRYSHVLPEPCPPHVGHVLNLMTN